MSLRLKLLGAVFLAMVLPMVVYLIWDATIQRSALVRDQADALRTVADVIDSTLESCPGNCSVMGQAFVDSFGEIHPGIELIVVDRSSNVVFATQRDLVGNPWIEKDISRVLSGDAEFTWDLMAHHGLPVMDVTVPMIRNDHGGLIGAIHLAQPMPLVDHRIAEIRNRHIGFVLIVVMLVIVTLGLLVYRTIIRRLSLLDREMRAKVNLGGIATPKRHGDEIEHLSMALHSLIDDLAGTADRLAKTVDEKSKLLVQVEGFNEELEREVTRTRTELEAVQQELIRAERLSTMGQLSAGLAHELRNPLFIIRASAELLGRKCLSSKPLDSDIIEEVDRVDAIITRLLDLARPLAVEEMPIDLGGLVREVADSADRANPGRVNVFVEFSTNPVWITGDRAFLRQALMNLVANACEVVDVGGMVRIEYGYADDARPYVKIKDNGIGISPTDLPHVFEPFFTKKPGGTGLGLASVKKILDLHSAEIFMESTLGFGTTVTVRWARSQEE